MGFLKGKKKSSGQSHNNFLEMLEEVTLKIDQMRATNEEIKKFMLLVLDGTNPELIEIAKRTLEDKISDNQKCGLLIRNDLKKELKKLDDASLQQSKDNFGNENNKMRIRKMQIANASRKFCCLLEEHNNQLEHYKSKSKEMLIRQCRIVDESITEEEMETVLSEGRKIFTGSVLDETSQARQQLNEIEDRHNEFLQLENSVKEVHELFVELSVMVVQQGETVDRIDMIVGDAEIVVHDGAEQIKQARRTKKKTRRLKTKLTVGTVIAAIISTVIIIAVI